MDPAERQALQSLFAAFADCLARGADIWERLGVSSDVLDFFRHRPVQRMPEFAEIWEAVRKVHHAEMVDIFGAESAEVSAMLSCTIISPFASPVSSSSQSPVLPPTRSPPSPQSPVWPSPRSPSSPHPGPAFRAPTSHPGLRMSGSHPSRRGCGRRQRGPGRAHISPRLHQRGPGRAHISPHLHQRGSGRARMLWKGCLLLSKTEYNFLLIRCSTTALRGSSLLPTTKLAFFTSLSRRLQFLSAVQLPQQTTA